MNRHQFTSIFVYLLKACAQEFCSFLNQMEHVVWCSFGTQSPISWLTPFILKHHHLSGKLLGRGWKIDSFCFVFLILCCLKFPVTVRYEYVSDWFPCWCLWSPFFSFTTHKISLVCSNSCKTSCHYCNLFSKLCLESFMVELQVLLLALALELEHYRK